MPQTGWAPSSDQDAGMQNGQCQRDSNSLECGKKDASVGREEKSPVQTKIQAAMQLAPNTACVSPNVTDRRQCQFIPCPVYGSTA